ncbi:MAG TPA: aminotransferase class V-fold PLP-dependent enzyme [Bryobacteraceae bacterium]|nr:aminotransferase class V-fold PLP-dependent enzyme [Bryobacteraceae bacterium]
MHRRTFLRATAGLAALKADSVSRARAAAASIDGRKPEEAARDEDFWREIQQAFTIDRNIINLNNGGVSPSPKVVQDAMRRELEFSNMAPAYTMWTVLEPEIESVRTRLAANFGCDPEELAITRNASEALQIVQLGLDLKPGDEVLSTDQDYPRMITTWQQRERRDGIKLNLISFPTPPPSMDDLYQRFERAITPRTRVIHFCHITNLTGQIFPVKRICEMARSRGIEAIVDGAHAYAQFPFKHEDLDCDYYGTSLHKWLLAPHGTGFLYVRKSKIEKLWPMMAAPPSMNANIRKFEEIGTHPAANHNAIAEALTFHESIGADRKAARLRYLRGLWTERLARFPNVTIRTSPDPEQSCGLVLVSVEGKKAPALADELWKQHRILVVAIVHKDFEGLRVTPNIYTTVREIDIFASAMEKLIRA